MLVRFSFLAASLSGLLISSALASPTPIVRPKAVRVRQETPEPLSTACGDVIDSVNEGYAYIYAADAYNCLTSVPFNAAVAQRFVDYVNDTLQFQSTLAYLKSPPVGYQQPAVDVLEQLQSIRNNVTTGVYKNQYQFEIDVQHLLYSTHDAHLTLTAGITAAFSFLAPFSVTAASSDGTSLPQVYITADVIKARNQSWTPSPIKTINDQDAVDYLTRIASLNSFGGIEAHADWNQLFHMPALDIRGDNSIWDGYVNFYPGDEINLTVANGTNYTDYWLALYNEPFATGPLTTGGDFYNYFVLGLLPASYSESAGFYNPAYAVDPTPVGNATAPVVAVNSWREVSYGAYPDPDVAQDGLAVISDGVVSGYFLQDVDAAVLSLPSFGQTGYSIGNFSAAVSYFIANVTNEGLTRVVIDLQQNTGGTVELAFSTFKRFFPDNVPFSGSRRRNHQLANTLGEAYTAYFNSFDLEDPRYNDYVADEWVVTPRLNAVTGQNFTSWAEYTGPVEEKDDSFSLTERYNLSSSVFDAALFEGWIPWGYTPEAPVENYTQPFATENIVLLTDGACSSTCALLVEMFTEVGVKTIVAGGRPITGPMQAVGGNRGAAIYSADRIDYDLLNLNATEANDTVLATVPRLNDEGYRDSGVFTTILGVNLRDQVRPNDTTPLQFKYEAADCRIFYTLDNVYNMSRLWRDAVSASFDNPSLCVPESTGFKNSSQSAPEPLLAAPTAPFFNITSPDEFLTAPTLDLSGGIQDPARTIKSGRITLCFETGCDPGAECREVVLSQCNRPANQAYFDRCVPIRSKQDECIDGTTFQPTQSSIPKRAGSPTRKGAFQQQSNVLYSGPCIPNANTFCVP
ncbi:hypothetical protein T440DRAFT_485816 [Plenodomus tracheiphilus IPT5]|uniref:Uncharacterized protein n=1 Tax=Plenodomus tracheiphilus IPT5 TaxID=1408161 RepID=A0A6A7BLN5_9PLEO|nr:hypothetical protein T440DRAFT_485816 [Plenodomus tracheiphilus IPT5]